MELKPISNYPTPKAWREAHGLTGEEWEMYISGIERLFDSGLKKVPGASGKFSGMIRRIL